MQIAAYNIGYLPELSKSGGHGRGGGPDVKVGNKLNKNDKK